MGQATLEHREQQRQELRSAQRDDSLRTASDNTLTATTARLEVLREGLRRSLDVTRALMDTTIVVMHVAELQLDRQQILLHESSALATRLTSQTERLDTLTSIAQLLETHTTRLVKPLGRIEFSAGLTYPIADGDGFTPYLQRLLGYVSDSLRRAPVWHQIDDSTLVAGMRTFTVYLDASTHTISRVSFQPGITGDRWLPDDRFDGPEYAAYSPICAPRIWLRIMTDTTQVDSLEWDRQSNYLAEYLAMGGRPYGWRAIATPRDRLRGFGIDNVVLNLRERTITVATHGDVQVNDNPTGILSSEELIDRFIACEVGNGGDLIGLELRWGLDGAQRLLLTSDAFNRRPGKTEFACYWAHITRDQMPHGDDARGH